MTSLILMAYCTSGRNAAVYGVKQQPHMSQTGSGGKHGHHQQCQATDRGGSPFLHGARDPRKAKLRSTFQQCGAWPGAAMPEVRAPLRHPSPFQAAEDAAPCRARSRRILPVVEIFSTGLRTTKCQIHSNQTNVSAPSRQRDAKEHRCI